MSLKQYITEAEAKQHIPQAGDQFAIELEDGTLLETYIMSINGDTIVLDATPKMISVLREWADLEGEASEVLFEGQFKQHMQDAAEGLELDDFVERFGHMFSPGEAREFWMAVNDVEDDVKLDETDYQTEIGIVDRGEYDQEGDMAKDDLATIVRAARKLTGMLDDNENMPEWVQSKINKAADYVDTAADYIESNKQDVNEDNSETNPVARAVLNRILMQHPGVLATHGPERVMNAIDELADYVNIGPDDEIGTSDVSGWTRDVIRMLAELPDEPLDEQGVAEGSDNIRSMIQQYEDMVELVYDLPLGRKKNIAIDKRDALEAQIEAMPGGSEALRQWAKSYNDAMDEGVAEGSLEEYGDTAKGQKMLTKVQKRAVDRMIKADDKRDAKAAKKNQDTANRAWDRMTDLDEQGVAEGSFDNASPMTKDTVKADRIRSLKNLIAIAKEQGRQLRVQELELELKKLQGGVAEDNMDEAKYQGREVALGKPTRGDVAKFKVYVRDPATGNIKKVNFGHGGTSAKRAGQKTMKIKKSDPARRRSFRARHNCDNPGPRTKARYWSCRAW